MGQLLFKKCFFGALRAGTKRTTLRRWTSARVKPGDRVFTPGVGFLRIESIDVVDLSSLKAADAIADGFPSLRAMRKMLAELYPDAAGNRDGREWFRIAFKVEAMPPSSARRSHAATPAKPRRAPRAKSKSDSSASTIDAQRRQLADALRKSPR